MKIAVLGGGSWGSAIARLLSNKGYEVSFYIRDKNIVENLNTVLENRKYLPGIKFNKIFATDNIEEAVIESELIILAVPTNSIRSVLVDLKIRDIINKRQIFVNLAKGIENRTLELVSEIVQDVFPENEFAVLSGPSHAEEVGKDIPTAVTVSSDNIRVAEFVQEIFSTEKFRVYTNMDLVGVEIGAALKNIIALAAGMSDGLGYGDNTKAALMTRGIYEMSKLGIKLGANSHTFNGLAGIGDLIVTCTSMHSRNRRAGILIGKGYSPEEAAKEVGQVVEGVKTTKAAYELSKKYNVSMPITEKLYEVLYNNMDPRKAVNSLMTRENKEEIEQIFFE